MNGKQAPIKKAWLTLRKRELKGHYDTDPLQWTCLCGAQKYHLYLLCKHLVQALPCPDANWWTTLIRYHTPPFYDIHSLLSPEDQVQAPEPEELGNRSWLVTMQGGRVGPEIPAISTFPVCWTLSLLMYTHTHWLDNLLVAKVSKLLRVGKVRYE